MSEIDRVDRKILNILLQHSSLPYRKIARKANISVGTVMNRIRKLREIKIIKNNTISIDFEQAGYGITAAIDIRVSKGRLFEVENVIAKNPSVFSIYDITGGFDALVLARFRNRQSLDKFLKRIQKTEHVERTNTKLILNTIKENEFRFHEM